MIKPRLLYVFLLVLSLAFLFFYQGPMSYAIVLALAAMFVFSLLSVVMGRFVVIGEQVEKQIVSKGEAFTYTIVIHNKSLFPQPVVQFVFYGGTYAAYEQKRTALSLIPPRSIVTESFSVRIHFRGVYPIGLREIVTHDFLGLFAVKRKPGIRHQVTVLPGQAAHMELPIQTDLFNKTNAAYDLFRSQYADISSVRKYEPSDDLKHIHWKLTAKRNELMVKNFQSSSLNRLLLFLETTPTGLRDTARLRFEDYIVSYAARCVHESFARRCALTMIWGNEEVERMDASAAGEEAFLITLAGAAFDSQTCAASMAERIINEAEGCANMVFVLHHHDTRLYEAIRYLTGFGHHVVIHYCFCEGETDESLRRLTAAGAHVYTHRLVSV